MSIIPPFLLVTVSQCVCYFHQPGLFTFPWILPIFSPILSHLILFPPTLMMPATYYLCWMWSHSLSTCSTAFFYAAAAKSLQSCPTLCDPRDGSPPGSAVPRILQARTLEWVAISFSNAWNWKVKVKSLSCVRLLVTPWTAAYQAPPPMGFYRQEYWSGVPLPSLAFFVNCNYLCTVW